MKKFIPLFIVLGVLSLFAAGGLCVYFISDKWSERGTIGDSFGAVNALFSGLAFAGVIYAILLQREELQLQRKEMKDSRAVAERSAISQAAQVRLQALTTIHAELAATSANLFQSCMAEDSIIRSLLKQQEGWKNNTSEYFKLEGEIDEVLQSNSIKVGQYKDAFEKLQASRKRLEGYLSHG